jgi:hypothetical protein
MHALITEQITLKINRMTGSFKPHAYLIAITQGLWLLSSNKSSSEPRNDVNYLTYYMLCTCACCQPGAAVSHFVLHIVTKYALLLVLL